MNNSNTSEIFKKMEELSWKYSERKLKNIAPRIVEVFIGSLRENGEFEIGISSEMWQKASVIKLDFPDIHMQAELKQKSDYYELNLLFYGAGLVSHRHKLTEEESELIPSGLKKLMATVKDLGESVRFDSRSIDEYQA